MDELVHVSEGDPHPAAHNLERDALNELMEEVLKRIPFPPGAAVGDLLRWDGSTWLTTETRLFEGEGNPNGQFAAPVGSRYVDKLATDGVVEWTKTEGGETNAGWTSKRERGYAADAKVCVTQGAANAVTGPVRVNFPEGRFLAAPGVSAIASDARITGVWATNVSSTGFDLYFRGTAGNLQFVMNWTAIVKG